MTATKAKEKIKVYANNGRQLSAVSLRKAKDLINAGVAETHTSSSLDDSIILTTDTKQEAFSLAKSNNQNVSECWGCGETISQGNKGSRNWCDDCKEKHSLKQLKRYKLYMKLRSTLMLERAIRIIENQKFPVNILDYKEASGAIAETIKESPEKFDSAHEIVAAMELIRQRIRIKVHSTVGKRRPDIIIPEEKIVLEIDGYMHEYKRVEDKQYDIEVRKELGSEWEVIRIPTKYIEENIKQLFTAAIELKKYIKKVRALNSGILPEGYSLRDRAAWKEVKSKLK